MTNSGYLYVLINPTLRANCYKIGKTNRSPHERARELSSGTGVATSYEVAYQKFFEDVNVAESKVHAALRINRINSKREFFDVQLHEAIQVIEAVANGQSVEPVAETMLKPSQPVARPVQPRAAVNAGASIDSKARKYQSFWEALVEAGIQESELWQGFTPRGYEHLTIPLRGVSRATYYLIVNQKQIHMELVFTTGEGSPNIEIFECLYERRAEVEAAFGQPLLWKRFAKTSKVQYVAAKGCYQESPDWPQLIQPTVQHFEPFWKAVQGYLEI